MTTRDIIVAGGSAGSVDALTRMTAQLPEDLPAALLLSVHMPPLGRSLLPEILSRSTPLKVSFAENGSPIEYGSMLIAPPDRHLIVEKEHVHLSRGPKENHVRPAINPLFRSAALAYGPRVIGVLLSGALDDGVSGLWELKRRGGIGVVQSPDDAGHPNIPLNAISHVGADHIGTAEEIGVLLRGLTRQTVGEKIQEAIPMAGIPTSISCPECRGHLDLFLEGDLAEYRCRVQHTYSPEAMIAAHAETEERTLWSAVVTLEEGAEVAEKLAPKLPEDVRAMVQESIGRRREAARQIRGFIESVNGRYPHSARGAR